jgi:hypothetical protein
LFFFPNPVDDPKRKDLSSQDFIGELETKMSAIVASPGRQITKPLAKAGKPRGTITVRADEVSSERMNEC